MSATHDNETFLKDATPTWMLYNTFKPGLGIGGRAWEEEAPRTGQHIDSPLYRQAESHERQNLRNVTAPDRLLVLPVQPADDGCYLCRCEAD